MYTHENGSVVLFLPNEYHKQYSSFLVTLEQIEFQSSEQTCANYVIRGSQPVWPAVKDSSTHMWSSSTLLLYLKFLSIELRRKRLQLKLKFEDRALIMMDRAAVHSCTTFKKARDLWQIENNCILLCEGSPLPEAWGGGELPAIPGGWGACGAPNDGFHQWFHALRRSWLRCAVGQGGSPHLRKALSDLDLSVNGDPRYKLSVCSQV